MSRYLVLIMLLLLTISMGTAAQDTAPRFEPAGCMFNTAFVSTSVECGYIIVPADQGQPGGATMRLAVAIFKSQADDPQPDPIIYLHGGPGGNALDSLAPYFDFIFQPLVQSRDVIMYDQRGTGYSEPSLDCPEVQEFIIRQLPENLTDAEFTRQSSEALAACHSRLVGDSIDLSLFNTRQSAADINALAQALGYDQLNLYGVSYGTRLALEVMRDYPGIVRSSVIDSVLPPQVDITAEGVKNLDRVVNALLDACQADPLCSGAYPDLGDVLIEAARKLNENPIMIQITLPSSGQTYDALMNGDSFFASVFTTFYSTETIPSLPQVVYDGLAGNFDLLEPLLGSFLEDQSSEGMTYSVTCNEEVPFTSLDKVQQEYDKYPRFAEFIRSDDDITDKGVFSDCAMWGAGQADPSENEPVVSDIPTLVINAQFDPVTPPEWGHLAAETLHNSYVFDFPHSGHGVTFSSECGLNIVQAFIDDPATKPDASCIADQPIMFDVPFQQTMLNPIAFSDPNLGVSGVRPAGWQEREPGVFEFRTGVPTLAYRVPEDGREGYIQRIIVGAYGYAQLPDSIGTYTANSLEWTLYEVEGQGVFTTFAFATNAGTDYVIGVVAGSPNERRFLYEALLLPALDAFRPEV